jgi:hypothetical protein
LINTKFFSSFGVDFIRRLAPADHASTVSPAIVAESMGGIEIFTAMRATGHFFRRHHSLIFRTLNP